MAEEDTGAAAVEKALPEPKVVVYHPITGVPEEFHEFLHKDCDEYKRLKSSGSSQPASAAAPTEAAAGAPAEGPSAAAAAAAAAPAAGGPEADAAAAPAADKPKGKKKKASQEIVITRATRQRKKAITTVEGLELFGVKLNEAAKLFGKKYACGASVTTNASQKEQIDVQGDVQDVLPELIIKQYGSSHKILPSQVIMIIDKQRVAYEP